MAAPPPPFDMEAYLTSTSSPYQSLTQLSGGTANFVYRMEEKSGASKIIKNAEPYIATAPQVPFPVDRMDFEHRALTQIPSHLQLNNHISMPEVYRYDTEKHVLMMSDGGASTLKDSYTDPEVNVQEYGRQLGAWLAALHEKTKTLNISNNTTAKGIYRFSYNNLSQTAKAFALDPELGKRINEKYGNLLATDDECVCHGDFWPGNVLVGSRGLMVVDWEMVRRGCGATDVGQFAAEAYLLDRFRGGRGLLGAFLEGYRQTAGQGKGFPKRVAVHMGVHLAFWPSRVEWGTKEETRECVVLGNEIMRRADGEDWDWLEGSVLRELF